MAVNREVKFLQELLSSGDMSTVVDNGINPKFLTGKYNRAFRFIQKHQREYGQLPTYETFLSKTDIELEVNKKGNLKPTGESMKYWCDELRHKLKHNTLADTTEEVTKLMNEGKVEEALALMTKTINKVENDIVLGEHSKINEGTAKRKDEYLKAQKCGGMTGIPSGITHWDNLIGGYNNGELITAMAYTGVGKANTLDTPVLTPNGFIPMGDVTIGTKVIGEDGKAYPVVAIHPQGVIPVYEVTFNDGTTSRCSKEHLWKFKTRDDRARGNDWRVDTLENMMKLKLRKGKSYNLVIPVTKPVEFNSVPLPVDSYVLGCLLGDGGFTTDRVSFTNPEFDLIDKLNILLSDWGQFKYHTGSGCQYEFKSNDRTCNKLFRAINDLQLHGVSSGDKYIPMDYLHSSINSRKELLKGLFDTDGHISPNGSYSITTSSKRLLNDLAYLCRSLGYRCTLKEYDRGIKGIEYRITILTNDVIFSSSKHKARYRDLTTKNREFDYSILKIVDIKQVGDAECQCISVDSKDHTYLCDDFIVTHNTWWELIQAVYLAKEGYKVLVFTTEMASKALMKRIDAIWCKLCYSRFKKGQLLPDEEKRFFKYLDEMEEKDDEEVMLVVEQATGGVSQISAKIDQYQPDIVFIDGAYLLENDDGDDDNWIGMVKIWRGLHKTAIQKDIPIVVTTQSKDETNATLKSAQFAKAIAQDCDVFVVLEQDMQMKYDREMKMKPLKLREGNLLTSVMLNWDFDEMDYSSLYSHEEKPDEEVRSSSDNVIDLS